MELWQIGVGFGVFFVLGLAFSISVFVQYRKDYKKMLERVAFLESNMVKALGKMEWGDNNETTERESQKRI